VAPYNGEEVTIRHKLRLKSANSDFMASPPWTVKFYPPHGNFASLLRTFRSLSLSAQRVLLLNDPASGITISR
jgi:hypothetical protein